MRVLLLCLTLLLPLSVHATDDIDHLLLETDRGPILIQLNRSRAPLTTEHIIGLVQEGHYDGLVFHRVIEDFVIQTGGRDRRLEPRNAEGSVPNESGNGLRNRRGSVALARGEDPHSGNSQFYINLGENEKLDPQSNRWGYAVFGHVLVGLSTADKIDSLPTTTRNSLEDVPEENVVIEEARLMNVDQALDWQETQDNGSPD